MNVPHVVRVFMKRACHNALATKSNLFRRKASAYSLCPLCGMEAETTSHVLWSCLATMVVWSMCRSKIQKRSIVHDDFVFIVEKLHRFLNKEDMELMAVHARLVWLWRNVVVYGRSVNALHSVVNKATESLMAFQSANFWPPSMVAATPPGGLCWLALQPNFVKIN